jgi:FKBP-type peptidyl-prolyl cis-trans isomerase
MVINMAKEKNEKAEKVAKKVQAAVNEVMGFESEPEEPEEEDLMEEEKVEETAAKTEAPGKPKPKNAKKWTPEQKKKIMQLRVAMHAFRSILRANGFEEKQIKDEENVLKYELTKDKIKITLTGNLLTYEIKVAFS